jgi:hypothetical protein
VSDSSSGIPAVVELITQVRAAAEHGLYYVALFGVLALPDICGALGSENGRASGAKYRDWLSRYVSDYADHAGEIYGLRCSILHQGQAVPDGSSFPTAFTFPPPPPAPQDHPPGTRRVNELPQHL